MKKITWIALLVAATLPLVSAYAQAPVVRVPPDQDPLQGPVPSPVDLSPTVSEVIRLAESGVGDEVVLAYIRNAQGAFSLSADHVVYLKDVGLSSEVITAMLTHDTSLRATQPPPTEPTPVPVPEPPPVVEQPAPMVVSSPPADVNYFYDDLAPYGTWVDLEGFGWCWQPRVVVSNRSWTPYCDAGHWVYSDAGWYWQSDYSWGWAPFHYGRWQRHPRCGWVWAPDRVWGPAWVTWRTAGDRCGWAPLPPHAYFDGRSGWRYNGVHVGVNFDFGLSADHFTFVGLHSFTDHDLRRHRLGSSEVRNVYRQTTVINNYTVNNNTIVNQGIPVERVSSATKREIRRASLRDVPAQPGEVTTRLAKTQTTTRNESVVYRPQLKTPTRTANVAVQKVDQSHPVIQHTRIAPTTIERRSGSSNFERRSTPAASPTVQTTEPRVPQTSGRQSPERSRGEKSQTSPRANSQPNVSPSAPSAPSAQPALQAPPAAPAKAPQQREPVEPASRSRASRTYSEPKVPPSVQSAPAVPPAVQTPSAAKRPEQVRQAENGATRSRSWNSAAPSAPAPVVAPVTPNQSRAVPPGVARGNPHVYYPKSQVQAADVRSLPPTSAGNPGRGSSGENQRSAPPSSQSRQNSGSKPGKSSDNRADK